MLLLFALFSLYGPVVKWPSLGISVRFVGLVVCHLTGPCVSKIKLFMKTSTYSRGEHPVSSGEVIEACGLGARL